MKKYFETLRSRRMLRRMNNYYEKMLLFLLKILLLPWGTSFNVRVKIKELWYSWFMVIRAQAKQSKNNKECSSSCDNKTGV